MTIKINLITAIAASVLAIAAAVGIFFGAARPMLTQGASDNNVLPMAPTATKVWVGNGGANGDTEVVSTSTGRVYLEIANISGATSTKAQALYCNVGGRAAVVYEGMVVHASSTYVVSLDNLMRGAIHCRFPVASSSVSVIDY